MAQEDYELHGVYEAVSMSSRGMKNDSPRTLALMERQGPPDDPYGGWTQVDSVHNVDVSEVPDGRDLAPGDYPAFGYNDDRYYAVYVKTADDGRRVATVAYHEAE